MSWNTGGAWVLLFVAAAAIELFAIVTHRRTLSQQVWTANRVPMWHWLLPVIAATGMIVLWLHFFMGLWE